MKKLLFSGLTFVLCFQGLLASHCQMPCGIYHDEMVFDQIDQYIETMAKGISILTESKFTTVQEKNEFIRWVALKETASDVAAEIITTYFLQQKIKAGEDNTVERLVSAHKLLFYLMTIKQTADLKYLNDFYQEWEKFKMMFHIEGYACRMEQVKLKKWAEKEKQLKSKNQTGKDSSAAPDHDHDHEHDHDHDDHDHPHTHN
ncbi:MAG: hypothetical protein H0W88_11055 [Parachlamydiaceae bacterium]|nr:hypothetical protein [Parachlamydiaceae bacterium]